MRIHIKRVVITALFFSVSCTSWFFYRATSSSFSFYKIRRFQQEHEKLSFRENRLINSLTELRGEDVETILKNIFEIQREYAENETDGIRLSFSAKTEHFTEKSVTLVPTIATIPGIVIPAITKMHILHNKVHNQLTEQELKEFYSRERRSEILFKNILDVDKDRKLLSTLFPSPNERNDRITDQLRLKIKAKKNKTILIWYGDVDMTTEKLFTDDCNVKDCIITANPKYLRHADAVLFQNMIPFKTRRHSSSKQIWVWHQLESALLTSWPSLGAITNWSATYRIDSVLNTPYERFTPNLNVYNLPNKPLKNYAKGKTKMVAWFVSNCGVSNERRKYANELSKHIQVDIYGKCGTLTCSRNDEKCFDKLKKDYKFYLSFENSNCKDYVSEKLFWNAYK